MNTILLLGQSKSGRHTLLQQCHPALKKETRGHITAWIHQRTQFLTVEQSLSAISDLPSIEVIAILISLPVLLDETQRLATINWITEQLSALKNQNTPIQFIISKADMLQGFREYFSNYTAEARTKALGIENFDDKQAMLDTISQSLLAQLHQEPLMEKRVHLQSFPQQLEQLMVLTEDIITRSLNNQWRFGGLFLISCKQKLSTIDLLTEQEKASLPILSQKVYFVNGLLDHLKSLAVRLKLQRNRRDKKRLLAIPLSIILIAGCVALWHMGYRQSVIAINQVSNTLKTVKNSPNDPAWLSQMNRLQVASASLDTPGSRYARYLGLPQTTELKERLQSQYQRLLITKFLPEAESQLTDTMTQALSNDPANLYASLRIYLMLVNGKHRDTTAISAWFMKHWTPHKQAASTIPHIKHLLALSTTHWPIDKSLIQQAQSTLQALPIANITYLILQAPYVDKSTNLSTLLPPQPYFNLKDVTLPRFFSTTQFSQIFNESIPKIVNRLKQTGDWVAGISQSSLSDETPAQVITSVRLIYISDFTQTWQALLPKLKLKPFQSMQNLETFISDLLDHQSSLHQLLSFVVGNATLDKDTKPTHDTQALSTLLHKKKPITQLQNIQLFIKAINKSKDPNQASLAVASTILTQATKTNPLIQLRAKKSQHKNMIDNWYHHIARDTWRLILANARTALDKQWQQTIQPLYSKSIKSHYPIDTTSNKDTPIATFTTFFGPGGALDKFTQKLKPFINTQQHYWTWQHYLGHTLGPSQSLLDNLMRASLIQQMFYDDHAKSPHFSFNLIPMTKSSHLKTVTSYFDGQKVPFDKAQALNTTITWPGPKQIGASWVIELETGQHQQHFVAGPWAALKLIQSGTLVPSTNPQKYTLTFKQADHEWQYLLIPSKKINPWLPQVIPQFTLPKTLLSQ